MDTGSTPMAWSAVHHLGVYIEIIIRLLLGLPYMAVCIMITCAAAQPLQATLDSISRISTTFFSTNKTYAIGLCAVALLQNQVSWIVNNRVLRRNYYDQKVEWCDMLGKCTTKSFRCDWAPTCKIAHLLHWCTTSVDPIVLALGSMVRAPYYL